MGEKNNTYESLGLAEVAGDGTPTQLLCVPAKESPGAITVAVVTFVDKAGKLDFTELDMKLTTELYSCVALGMMSMAQGMAAVHVSDQTRSLLSLIRDLLSESP